jgi:hypothetical protein
MTPEETKAHLFTEADHPDDWEQGLFETRMDYARSGEGFSDEQALEWAVAVHKDCHDPLTIEDYGYETPNHNHDDGTFVPKPEVEVSLEDVVEHLKGLK